MIGEPPLIRLLTKGSRKRPTQEQIDAFAGAQTGHVCDALGGSGALDPMIKPMDGCPISFCGPALTADCGPADLLALACALHEVTPGDVVIAAVDGHQGCAVIGDMVVGMAKNAGAVGFVTDGMVRDIQGIRDVRFPVFATGINPNSPMAKGPGAVGHPVHVGGRRVASGDMLIGDEDGVVAVPYEQIDAVLKALDEVRKAEVGLEAKVNAGLKHREDIPDLLASDAVERT